jgi:hypothetical protein
MVTEVEKLKIWKGEVVLLFSLKIDSLLPYSNNNERNDDYGDLNIP